MARAAKAKTEDFKIVDPWAVILELDKLPRELAARRELEGLGLAEAGVKIGCARNTYARLERGEGGSLELVVAALRWLGAEPTPKAPEAPSGEPAATEAPPKARRTRKVAEAPSEAPAAS